MHDDALPRTPPYRLDVQFVALGAPCLFPKPADAPVLNFKEIREVSIHGK